MLFERKKRDRDKKGRISRNWEEKLHKLIFFAGAAIALKGLKGWIKSKKRKMMH